MRQGGSAKKGASFERRVCKELSLWISSGKRDDIFWRSAMSGGRATIGLRKGITRASQAGDMVAISRLGEGFLNVFVVEHKHRRDLQLDRFLTEHKGNLMSYWRKHMKECKAFKKHPFLVAKQNRTKTLLLLTKTGMEILGIFRCPSIFRATISIYSQKFDRAKEIFIVDYTGFLSRVSPTLTHIRRQMK